MLLHVINKVAGDLSSCLDKEIEMETCKLTMVNYSYSLPGNVNLDRLTKDLSEKHNMLVIFNPSKYAGVNVKLDVDGAECSILIFLPGKLIISTPQCEDRDKLLFKVIEFIETRIVQEWDLYELQMHPTKKRNRQMHATT